MDSAHHLSEIVIMLVAAIGIVALFRRLRLSPVLGYLTAGIALGPHGIDLLHDVESTRVIAEFGVVFLLFVIGLELSFERLRRMPARIFGYGLLQLGLTCAAIGGMALGFGATPEAAVVIGGGLALSSTAIVLELMRESNEKSSHTGRLALATLILQDLAVIPLLVIVPLLAAEGSVTAAIGEATAKAAIGLAVIFLVGRRLLRPIFRQIAAHNHHELFTATTLLVVLGLAYISALAGISPALGAFMGGLLVAETEFRPQVEADILPFKGLLLGLFFITVGMSINLELARVEWLPILTLTALLIASKALVMLGIGAALKFPRATATHTALLLAQGGEFAFVLFALADKEGLITTETAQMLITAVAFSMAATPLLNAAGKAMGRIIERSNPQLSAASVREAMDLHDHVIITGFGRVGKLVAKLLEAERIPYVALDMDAATVGNARERGQSVFYGDASRAVVLRAIGFNRAQALIITHSELRSSLNVVRTARGLRGNVPIIARARSIEQVLQLESAGATLAVAEMFETSLQLGGLLLREIGIAEAEVARLVEAFRAGDYALSRNEEKEKR